MKVFGLVLLAFAAFAVQAQAQAPPTLGDVVSNICPEAAAALEKNTILSAGIASAADATVELPEGETPVIIAPSDAAFVAALTQLGATSEDLLNDQDTLAAILSLHLAIPDGSTVEGTPLEFTADGEAVDLAGLIASDGVPRVVTAGASKAAVENVVECADGSATVVFVDTVLLPVLAGADGPGAAPAPAPAPTPSGPVTTTIAGLLDIACPSIVDVLTSPDFSTLAGLITRPDIADIEITIPEGSVILAAPTNAAFAALLAALPAGAANNASLIAGVLANHIAVSQDVAADFPAETLAGENLSFWRAGPDGAPLPVSAADVAADPEGALITDADISTQAAVAAAVGCPEQNQWAFAIDKVLVPSALTPPAPKPAPAPTPAPAPAPKPVLPPPAPVSGAAGVRAAVAAAVVAAAALLA